jgi:putative FmdB family regulatory protein
MPLYEYECGRCGVFSAMKKISAFDQPAQCDTCGESSARVISVPHYALLGKAVRIAHERNEQSAHEPRAFRRSGCGCSGKHTCQTSNRKTENVQGLGVAENSQPAPFQKQTKSTARPWMLGH